MEGYAPFKMKAADYGNSPMLKNFPDAFPGGVGDSPAKGWFTNIAKKVKNLGKKVLGKTAVGRALGIGKEKKDPTGVAADAMATASQPHTHDETGVVVPEAEGVQQPVAKASAGPASIDPRKQQKFLRGGLFGGGISRSAMGIGGGGGMWGSIGRIARERANV
jgi:hypothetical protein